MTVDPLLRAREGAALLGVSIATFWRRVDDGTIPPPVRICGASRWPQSDFVNLIEAAKDARRSADRRCGSCRHAVRPSPEDAANSMLVALGKAEAQDIVHCTALSLPAAKQFVPKDCKMKCWEGRDRD